MGTEVTPLSGRPGVPLWPAVYIYVPGRTAGQCWWEGSAVGRFKQSQNNLSGSPAFHCRCLKPPLWEQDAVQPQVLALCGPRTKWCCVWVQHCGVGILYRLRPSCDVLPPFAATASLSPQPGYHQFTPAPLALDRSRDRASESGFLDSSQSASTLHSIYIYFWDRVSH